VVDRPVISNWAALLNYVSLRIKHEKSEQARVLYLDRKNKLIADEKAGQGTVDHAPVYPREIARRALELSASSIILVHNHPSGDPDALARRHRPDARDRKARSRRWRSRCTTISWSAPRNDQHEGQGSDLSLSSVRAYCCDCGTSLRLPLPMIVARVLPGTARKPPSGRLDWQLHQRRPAGDAPAGGQSFGTRSYRGYVLLSLTLVYTLNFIDRNLLGVVAQPIIAEFGLTDTEYGFLNGPPFALFYALMGIPIAIAADRYNRVVIMALCIAVWSLMTALCGFASSFVFLLIARVGVAIGEAGGTPPSNSIIADYFKPKSRANALGIFAMGVTLGGALANGFGGPIAGLTDETVVSLLQPASASATFTNSSAGARISAGASPSSRSACRAW
jgi:hypothetical protein